MHAHINLFPQCPSTGMNKYHTWGFDAEILPQIMGVGGGGGGFSQYWT